MPPSDEGVFQKQYVNVIIFVGNVPLNFRELKE